MMVFQSFGEMFGKNILPTATIDGIEYRVGPLTLPNGKKLVLGITGTTYDQKYLFHIGKTIADTKAVGEVKKLSHDCDHELQVFKYTPLNSEFNFVIIRGINEQALSKEEANWLWDRL